MSGYAAFSPKRPAEEIVLAFDFADDLPAGVTLASVQAVDVELVSGTDPTPAAVKNGAPTVAGGSVVLQGVKGGQYGCAYLIVPRVVRSDGEIREMPRLLVVQRVV